MVAMALGVWIQLAQVHVDLLTSDVTGEKCRRCQSTICDCNVTYLFADNLEGKNFKEQKGR